MKPFNAKDIMMPDDVAGAFIYAKRYRSKFPKNGKYTLDQVEGLISSHPFASYQYALAIGKRFYRGESKIAECPFSSYYYVTRVLGSERWAPCEASMLRSPSLACLYAIDVVKGEWPEAEHVIMGHEKSAIEYMAFLKERAHDTARTEGQGWEAS